MISNFTSVSINTSLLKTFIIIPFLLIVAFTAQAQYCSSRATGPASQFGGGVDIGSVEFFTLKNGNPLPVLNNGSTNPFGYSDFTSLPAPVVSLNQVVPIIIKYINKTNSQFPRGASFNVYIDYNIDGDFTDAGETVFTGSPTSSAPNSSGTVTIPVTANIGVTRMRVVMVESNFGTPTISPCGNYTEGETEDYSVEIVTPLFADDIGITTLQAPLPPVPGSQLLRVRMRNYGYNTINSATISYTINGGAPVDFNYTGPAIATNATSGDITLGTAVFAANDLVRVYSRNPTNGATVDPNNINDTLIFRVCSGTPALIGTKTIGGVNPNYATILDAVTALNCNGISGPVTFNIRPGFYNERIFLLPVVGSSSTNIITFTTVGAAKDVTLNGTFGNTIHLNGADYVTVKNLIILNKGFFEGAGILLNNQADFNTVENCVIRVDSTSKENKFVGIGALSSFVGSTTGNHANNTTIKNNIIVGGAWGVYFTGTSTTVRSILNTITGNTISKTYNSGIFVQFNNGTIISTNKIISREESNTTSTGISLIGSRQHLTQNPVVSRNYVNNVSLTGILLSDVVGISATNSGDFSNNMVAGGFKSNSQDPTAIPTGISVNACSFINFYFNSVNMDAPSPISRAFFQTGGANLKISGNIFSNDSTGVAYFITTPLAITQSDFNNYYSAQGQFFANWNAIGYADVGDLAAINLRETGSLNLDPLFFAFNDLHTSNPALDGTGPSIVSVSDDYDGESRFNLTPSDIGADAFQRFQKDLAVVDISPKTLKVGKNAIEVTIKNFGTTDATGTCNYRVLLNSTIVLPNKLLTFSSTSLGILPLKPGESRVFQFNLSTDSIIINTLGNYTVCVRPSTASGCFTDNFLANDGLCIDLCTGKAGDILVGSSRPIKKIQDALDELICGIASKVTIKVDPGTYNEQLTINRYINSSNDKNITITSATGIASDVIIKYAGISAVNHSAVIFNGSKDVVIKNVTIINDGFAFGSGIHITNACENVKVIGCIIKVDSTSNRTSFAPITASALGTFKDKGKNGNFITIKNNNLSGGFYGINMNGKDESNRDVNDSILNNNIRQVYSYGIFTSSTDARIEYNTITGRKVMNTTGGTGIFVSFSKFGTINANQISAITFQGISVLDVGQGSKQWIISNNFVGAGFTYFSNTASAISVRSSTNVGVHFNSVNFDGDTISAGALNANDIPSGNLVITNNIFATINGAKILNIIDASSVANSNNNNLFQSGLLKSKSFAFWGKGYRSLKALQTATGKDKNSISVLPNFRTETDLHSKNPAVDRKGSTIKDILFDVDKEIRRKLPGKPDIGADEFVNTEFDLDVTAVLNNVVRRGNNFIAVKLTNVGLKSLAGLTAQLEFSIDGAPFTGASTVSLTPLDKIFKTFNFVFPVAWNNIDRLDHDICVRVKPGSLPLDTVNNNDFACDRVCTGLDGNKTVGNFLNYPNADFQTIQEALDSIGCGIAGPLNIRIYPGVYAEKLIIPFLELSYENPFMTITSFDKNNKAQIKVAGNNITRSHAVIRLDGTRNVRISNLLIENLSSTFSSAIQLTNNAKNNIIDSCDINVNKTSTTTQNIAGIVSSSPFSIYGSATNSSKNIISNNIITGGYYGIFMIGNGEENRDQGNIIRNNTIKDFVLAGISTRFVDLPLIQKNRIAGRTPGSNALSKGIFVSFSYGDQKIDGNFIEKVQYSGIELLKITGTKEFIISNNLITSGFKANLLSAGIIADTCNYVGVYHNNVRFDGTGIYGSAFRATEASAIMNVNNNIFSNFGSGVSVHISNIREFFLSNNNDLYVANTANRFAIYSNGIAGITSADVRANLLGYQDASGLDENSFALLPPFNNINDMELTSAIDFYKKGKTVDSVLRDYKFNKRSPRLPTVGAYEYYLEPTDISIIKVRPDTTFLGNNDVKVTLLNEGNTSIIGQSINVQFKLASETNWRAPEVVTLSTLDTTYDREVFTFTGKLNLANYNTGRICVRIVPPGLTGDNINNPINLPNYEELCQDFCTAIKGGTYTVGGPTADFLNLAQVANALQCGYTDSVVFNIISGRYNERFTLPAYFEKGPENSITFQSVTGNPDDVIIDSVGKGFADHAIIRLNGTGYVRFLNLTIKNTGSSRGSAIHFSNGANNNLINNCKILLDTLSPANSLMGVVMSSNSGQTDATGAFLNRVSNSFIQGGAYGIHFKGFGGESNSSNNITNNIFRNNNVTAIKVINANVNNITKNNIIMRKNNRNSFGIDLDGMDEDINLSNNYLYGAGDKGFTLKNLDGLFKNVISNNMLAGGFINNNVGGIGMEMIECANTDVIHNSVRYDSLGVDTGSIAFNIMGGDGNRVYNNIFSNFGGGYGFVADDEAANSEILLDRNLLWTSGSTLGFWGSDIAATLPILITKSNQNLNSISKKPVFFSPTDLHTSDVALNGKGLGGTTVIFDYDNELRNLTTPDIGADEFVSSVDGGVIEIVSPNNSAPLSGLVNVIVKVKNFGTIDYVNPKVEYQVTGELPVSQIFTTNSTIKPDSVKTFTFSTKWPSKNVGNLQICARTIITDDLNTLNDSSCLLLFNVDTIDLSVSYFVTPIDGAKVSPNTPQSITIVVTNFSNTTVNKFDLNLDIDGSNVTVMPVTNANLEKLSSLSYTFTPYTLNTVLGSTYNLCAYPTVIGETNFDNDTACITVTGDFPNIIGQTSIGSNLINVFPNPANSILNFDLDLEQSENVRIEMYDIIGKMIKAENLGSVQAGKQIMPISISDLANGNYVFRVLIGNKSFRTNIIVSK